MSHGSPRRHGARSAGRLRTREEGSSHEVGTGRSFGAGVVGIFNVTPQDGDFVVHVIKDVHWDSSQSKTLGVNICLMLASWSVVAS